MISRVRSHHRNHIHRVHGVSNARVSRARTSVSSSVTLLASSNSVVVPRHASSTCRARTTPRANSLARTSCSSRGATDALFARSAFGAAGAFSCCHRRAVADVPAPEVSPNPAARRVLFARLVTASASSTARRPRGGADRDGDAAHRRAETPGSGHGNYMCVALQFLRDYL